MRSNYIPMLANGVGTLVALALQIAFLIAVLTVVRRHRPSAVPTLAAAAIVGIVGHILQPIAYAGMAAIVSSSGIDSYMIASAAISLGFSLVYAVSSVLLIVGVVRLATPES